MLAGIFLRLFLNPKCKFNGVFSVSNQRKRERGKLSFQYIPIYARIVAGGNEAWELLTLSNHNKVQRISDKPFSNKVMKGEDVVYQEEQQIELQTT